MTPNPPTTTTTILLACIVFVIGLLVWSVNQTAALKIETHGSIASIVELEKEVTVLREELASVKPELIKAISLIHEKKLQIALMMEQANQPTEINEKEKSEISMPVPADIQADLAQDGRLEDMPHPQQESSGLTEGNKALSKLNYNNAIKNFTKVESEAADFIKARMGVANALFYSHQYEKAVTEFAYVLSLQPDSVEAVIGLANAHQRLGQRPEQIAAYDRAIGMEPKQWLHYNSRATAYLMSGDNERAIQDFRQASRLASPVKADQATAFENIGLIHLWEEHWQQAFQHANEVNKLDTQHSWNWLIRGIAAAKLKRNVDAYVSFDEWFKYKRPTDPYLLKQLLPESIHVFVDVSPAGLSKLVDPPLVSGELCENNSQCRSNICRPGAPFNKPNYCVVENKHCSAANSNGYLLGESIVVDGIKVRCYQPDLANARWTVDNRVTN